MARRQKKQPSGLVLRLKTPWVILAGCAVATLVASLIIAPMVFAAHPVAAVIGRGVIPLGLGTSIVLGLIAAGLYFKQRNAPVVPQWTRWTKGISPYSTESKRLGQQAAPASIPSSPGSEARLTAQSNKWSNELLSQMEAGRVEALVAAYFREKTFRTESLVAGPLGGIDIKLFSKDKAASFAIVQCAASDVQKIDVEPVRELLGVMAREAVAKGIHVTTGAYTQDAIDFARQNPIKLINGDMLLKGIVALPADARQRLLLVATEGATEGAIDETAESRPA
jgi:hypothetical protein